MSISICSTLTSVCQQQNHQCREDSFLKWTNLSNPRSWSPREQAVEAFSPGCASLLYTNHLLWGDADSTFKSPPRGGKDEIHYGMKAA